LGPKFWLMNSKKIVLPLLNGKVKSFNLNDILFCKSNGYLSIIYYKQNDTVEEITVNKRLGCIEEILKETCKPCYRTHRSYVVNADNLESDKKHFKSELKFHSGVAAKLSRRKKSDFVDFYKKLKSEN